MGIYSWGHGDIEFYKLDDSHFADTLKQAAAEGLGWMTPPERPQEDTSTAEINIPWLLNILEEAGYDANDSGNNVIVTAAQEEKHYTDHLFFSRMAAYISPGSTFEWQNERGEFTRWTFENRQLMTQKGRVVYD